MADRNQLLPASRQDMRRSYRPGGKFRHGLGEVPAMANRVALITGAGGGLGSSSARLLMRDGCSIVGIGRSAEPLDRLRADLEPHGEIVTAQIDVTSQEGPQKAVQLALDSFGRLDVLVNNAGIGYPKPIDETTDEIADLFIDSHLRSAFRFARDSAAVMGPGSAIVNIHSCMGLRGRHGGGIYTAVKSAISGLTWQFAAEYGPKGIRTNAVAPGVIATDMSAGRMGNSFFERHMLETVPMPYTTGKPDDIGEAVAYLASDKASFVNGHVLVVDGGWSTTHYLNDAALSR
jgi:NAD(P)-dependent dehydrogenase (short-subunit alcohol dehydrogenase family)